MRKPCTTAPKGKEKRKYSIIDSCLLHSTPNIVQVIRSRRMKWAEHVARMGESRGEYRISVGKPEGKKTTLKTLA
jgi:hypothetical protein